MSENHQNEENCIVFVENCVERNDRLRANEGFQKIYEYIFFNVVKITHDLKKTFDRYTKLLNEENRELIKQVIQKKKYYDFSSISTETQAFTEQSEINDDTNSVAYNMSSIHESELEPFRRPIEEEKLVEQKHTFSQLWLLDKIRRLYYNEDIYDLPKMIFDKVNNLHPNEMFEKKFVLSPPTFVNREDNLSNVYLPVFSNTPTLLTPTNEYCLRRQTLPLIFKYYLANDVRLGNVILVRSPNKNQINGGCKIFGFFFEFIGIIPKEPFLGVFLNMKYSVDKQILFGDYPGIEDKSSKINSTQYSSLFQTGIFCNSKDIINYEPEIIETTPYVNEQISFTGIVSTDLVSTIWSNISRDSKESYTIPKVVRMLYCGYFGDFIVTPSIGNSKVKVHKQMKTPINDTSFIILYDHSNTIPYGNISNNIVALLLHYSVPIKTLFDPIPNYISNHLNATLQISNPLHHLISVVDDPNDYYIDTVKKFVRFENIILRHQIPLNHSYHLIGVLDPLNELKKGEVVIGLDNPTVKSFGETILVANNNDLHPFSLQRFNIKNDNYSLKSILGVIVFSLYDAYYYLNSSFDSLKFKLRNSDFVIIGENQKGNKKSLLPFDTNRIIQLMDQEIIFNQYVSKILTQMDEQSIKLLKSHLLISLMEKNMSSFQSFATTYLKLMHTDKLVEVKEEVFGLHKVSTPINFFGVQLLEGSVYHQFNKTIFDLIEKKGYEFLQKFQESKEMICNKTLLEKSKSLPSNIMDQTRKQWFRYSSELGNILKGSPTTQMEYFVGASLKGGSIEHQLEHLKKKYRIFNSPIERKQIALARYRLVYTEPLNQKNIILSPSFAYLIPEDLFINSNEAFAVGDRQVYLTRTAV